MVEQPHQPTTMKPKSPRNLATLCALGILLLTVPKAMAQVDATAWTSVEGTTLWARLEGWDGSHVLLGIQGRQYRVPLSRFAPKSAEKARRLLKLPTPHTATTVKPVRTAEVAADHGLGHDVRPNLKLVLAWEKKQPPTQPAAETQPLEAPPPSLAQQPTPTTIAETPVRQAENSATGLPELSEAPDPDHDGYAAVLPERETSPSPAPTENRRWATLVGRQAIAPTGVPGAILTAIEAGNRLQTKTYKWGGGRARLEDTGYDCSGSVSYVLIKAGLLSSPLTSGSFTRYGAPGPGRWITIHARNGHVFMTLCGIRLDTGGHTERGPRWCADLRGGRGFVMRHPPGF